MPFMHIRRAGRHGLAVAGVALALLGARAALAGGPADGRAQAAPEPTDRLIVKYRDGAPGAAASAPAALRSRLHRIAKDAGLRHGVQMQLLRLGVSGTHVMRLERRLRHAEAQALARDIAAQDPDVEYAEPDRILQAQLTPNDIQYGQQWHYYEAAGGLNLPPAWDRSTGAGVVVAVIDTGYRPHVDLAASVLPGFDMIADTFVANDGTARDGDALDPGDAVAAGACGGGLPAQDRPSSWHGTHVAGTVAALSNNGSGGAGVAFGARILPVRVLGRCGGYTSDIAAAMVWASGGAVPGLPANPTPARVLNLSLGGGGACDITSQNAIDAARSRGAVVVVAAGNSDGDAADFSPASCAGVIAVAATDRSGGKAYYSNRGAAVAVAAPGGDMRWSVADGILSTFNAGSTAPGADIYAWYQGTSMATPHVSGVVALMLSRNPALTPDEVAARLKSSARPFPVACAGCGAGIVDAAAAVEAAGGTPAPVLSTVNELESNNSMSSAQRVQQPVTVQGTIGSRWDTDYYRVVLGAGRTLAATLAPNAASDYDLYVYNGGGALVASSLQGTGAADSASVTNGGAASATYYVRVRYYSGGTGSTGGRYTLTLQ